MGMSMFVSHHRIFRLAFDFANTGAALDETEELDRVRLKVVGGASDEDNVKTVCETGGGETVNEGSSSSSQTLFAPGRLWGE